MKSRKGMKFISFDGKSIIGGVTFFTLLFYSNFIHALPQGYEVQAGSAEFDKPTSNTLNILTSDKVIINYQSFSIAPTEVVNFLQPSPSSVALNRVVGTNPSEIFGKLTATGRIFLINPNGIMFGPNSHVDVPGLVVSTLDISDDDFLKGNYVFHRHKDKIGASVINKGYIQARQAVLMGSAVRNEGRIIATLGRIILASGEEITLNLDTAGMISVVIDEPVKEILLRVNKGANIGVENRGQIRADGGVVILTAKALDGVFDYAVNNEGIIEANAIEASAGRIRLIANQRVNVAGRLSAEGGTIEVDSQGANFSGEVNSAKNIFNMNDGDTTINGGSYNGDTFWSDDGNITVRGDLTVNGGSLTLKANADKDGFGDFIQDYGLIRASGDIKISGYNVKIRAVSCGGDLNIDADKNITIGEPWKYKREFRIDHDLIAADLSDFPVLVKLDASNFNFSHAKPNGEDIRFVSEDGVPLPYEIERWDKENNEAYIWVKLPLISSSADTKFYMYYGNPRATDTQSPHDVWDHGYSLVLHLNETSGLHYDSTSNQNDATAFNGVLQNVEGKIAGCDSFDGVDDYLKIEHADSLNPGSGITVEAWVKIQDLGTWAGIIAKDASVDNNSYALFTDTSWDIMKFSIFKDNQEYSSGDWNDPDLNQWIYVVGVYDGSNIQIYANGELKNQTAFSQGIDDSTADVMIARDERMSNLGNDSYLKGYIDEVRISNVPRDFAWISASYNTVSNSNFLTSYLRSALQGVSCWGRVRYYIFSPHPYLVSWLPEREKGLELIKQIFKGFIEPEIDLSHLTPPK